MEQWSTKSTGFHWFIHLWGVHNGTKKRRFQTYTHIHLLFSTFSREKDHLWRCSFLQSATLDDSPPINSSTTKHNLGRWLAGEGLILEGFTALSRAFDARKSSETSRCWLSAVAPLLWMLRENWREAGSGGLGNMEPLKRHLKDRFGIPWWLLWLCTYISGSIKKYPQLHGGPQGNPRPKWALKRENREWTILVIFHYHVWLPEGTWKIPLVSLGDSDKRCYDLVW